MIVNDFLEVETDYFDTAWQDPDWVIEQAEDALVGIDYDTFVVTGMSGAVVAGLLAHALGKSYLLLRKPDDTSTHSYERALGKLGRRWVFLDDFVSSGATRRRVHAQMEELLDTYEGYLGRRFETTCVGTYEYMRDRGLVPYEDYRHKIEEAM